jgi:hypothetical protein
MESVITKEEKTIIVDAEYKGMVTKAGILTDPGKFDL